MTHATRRKMSQSQKLRQERERKEKLAALKKAAGPDFKLVAAVEDVKAERPITATEIMERERGQARYALASDPFANWPHAQNISAKFSRARERYIADLEAIVADARFALRGIR